MSKAKILIAADDPSLRNGLRLRLRADGFETVHAMDGYSGIAVCRKEHPDLIVLDLELPAGDGFQVLEKLQQDYELAHIPVIVLTPQDSPPSQQRALKMGAVAAFHKPAGNHEVLQLIRAILNLNRSNPEHYGEAAMRLR